MGEGGAKFDFTKIFRNQLFSRVRALYHQYSITNHNESIFKFLNHEYFNDYFCCCFFYLIC